MSVKISDLGAAAALTGAELVEIVQGGTNVQSTTQDIADLGGGGGIAAVVDDTTPQLGGNLDVNGNDITGATINIGNSGTGAAVNIGNDDPTATINIGVGSSSAGTIATINIGTGGSSASGVINIGGGSTGQVLNLNTDTVSLVNGQAFDFNGGSAQKIDELGLRGAASANQVVLTLTSTAQNIKIDRDNAVSNVILPDGTTGERPATAVAGAIRYNTTTGKFEGYDGSWVSFGAMT